ncbi:hydrolethalus syndrome protein 1 homolog [Lingula anatina]|uniref:Hydrolethalus syndrome protein 1 homolog n=1 Tax=Lingula anatina TaxID=7574 RepID=A0A1S3K1E5_LINAN|nr:hydrolethalus syndrome protein 1 homolog [Lingula anatina]|eukprot:XP_013416450.1 hydrolethalus syndrome protein 1 homolog [Lingula anatina]
MDSEFGNLTFSDQEIREQLEALGYHNVPQYRLEEFRRDLEELVQREKVKSSRESSASSGSQLTNSYPDDQTLYRRGPLEAVNDAAKLEEAHSEHSVPLAGSHARYGKENQYTTHVPYGRKSSKDIGSVEYHSRYPHGVVGSMGDQMYEGHPEDSFISDTTSDSRKMIKRKVLRKQDGHSVIDESYTESEAGDLSVLEERLSQLPLSDPDTASEDFTTQRRYPRRPYSSRDLYSRMSNDDPYQKSVIWPSEGNPHTKDLRKCDPVKRYHQFKQAWQQQKAPGEKKHKGLRWDVREQMLYHDEVVKKPQRVFVPNTYKVPTDKRRKALRWQIRTDMAQGVMPSTGY